MEMRDPFSSVSHLLTALWAAYATLILIRLTPNQRRRRLALAVFGLSMVVLYTASGTFHGLPYNKYDNPAEFSFFQRIDQSAIYVLIAGTNTPCLAILLPGARGKRFLAAMWLIAATGITCLWVLPKAPHWLIVTFCLSMGWLGLAPGVLYYRLVGWRAMNWVILGGGFYTFGAICELTEWPNVSAWPVRIGYHEIFHLCDTAGSIAFFLFVARHVATYEPPAVEPLPEPESELTAA